MVQAAIRRGWPHRYRQENNVIVSAMCLQVALIPSIMRVACLQLVGLDFFWGKGRNNWVQWKMMVLECKVSADLKREGWEEEMKLFDCIHQLVTAKQ